MFPGLSLLRPAGLRSSRLTLALKLPPSGGLSAGWSPVLSPVKGPCTWAWARRGACTAAPSEEGRLIYTGSLGSAVRGVKLFSYSSSGFSLLLMPQILLQTGLGGQSPALQAAFCTCVGFFTFLTPALLHMLTRGYVVRLYHHAPQDTYTAITYSPLLTEKKLVFHQDQVRVPAVSRMFTSFYAGHRGLLVNPDLFHMPLDYNHLMGYDKPFSFSQEDLDPPHRP
ncbi:transmembrane protein 70, mitochondrial [Menidia menidia]